MHKNMEFYHLLKDMVIHMKQSIRIIGGKYRGKQLVFPSAQDLRPTPNRVRETLFNWLMHDIRDAVCLDAFAGSGALGFEAYSRSAKKVVLIEKSLTVVPYLTKYVTEFNPTKAKDLVVLCKNSLDYIKTSTECFDIIFLDPPFNSDILKQYIEILENTHKLKDGGLLYVESATDLSLDTENWTLLKKQRAGQVFYFLFKKKVKLEKK